MDDLYFEKELRKRIRDNYIKSVRSRDPVWGGKDEISGTTRDIFGQFDYILDSYYTRKYGDEIDYRKICKLVEEFEKNLTDNSFMKMYKEKEFSNEEMDYIYLVESSSKWRDIPYVSSGAKYATIEILLRDLIIREFGEDSLPIFIDIAQNEIPSCYRRTSQHFIQLFSDKPYGENVHEELEEEIEKKTDYYFNQKINCGGYSMKIDECIFPSQDNFSASVSYILDHLDFVRLLGDKPLQDDEYLVMYRAPKGKATGHHFIRVDSDGTVREKNGCEPTRIFEDWGNLETCPEALFAVKKDHKMFGHSTYDINFNGDSLDFEGTVAKAYRDRCNIFSYHSHNFCLKKSSTGDIYVTTTTGEIVAEAIVDENDCAVEILEGKSDYVENISNGVKPIIIDGKLVNFDKFRDARAVGEYR